MWYDGSPVSFQRFVNSLYGKPEEKYLAILYQTMIPPLPEFWSLSFSFRKNPYETLLPHKEDNTCSCMLLSNLAEPDWITIPCDQQMLADTICTVNQIDKHPKSSSCGLHLDRFCEKGQISFGNLCLYFSWNITNRRMGQGIPTKAFPILNATHLTHLAKAAGKLFSPIYFPENKASDRVHIFTFNHLKIEFVHKIGGEAPTKGFPLQYSQRAKIHADSNVFKCSDGSHIAIIWVCDGSPDCFSASDELFCTCTFVSFDNNQTDNCQKFMDGDTHTCSALYIKDAKGDCLKFTDTSIINFAATSQRNNFFLCNETDRIDATLFNDLIGDCSNAEDEQELVSLLKYGTTAKCRNNIQLPCLDGHSGCFNISDLCTYKLSKYSNLSPCRNGGHLEYCVHFHCNTLFKCPRAYCIPWAYLCDMKWDCPLGNDESDLCSNKNLCEGMFRCKSNVSQFCVHLGTVCDDYNDCPKGDDEFLCVISKLTCPSGCQCLALAMMCASSRFVGTGNDFPHVSVSLVQVSLDMKILKRFPQAIYFALIDLGITDICHQLSTQSLASLNANHNNLLKITHQCFGCQTNLRVLQMSHNQIHSVAATAFVCLPSLTNLNLSFNNLVIFPIDLLRSARSIEHLSLIGLTFYKIELKEVKDAGIREIQTTDYHVCCVDIFVKCKAEKPWYVSCGTLLSQAEFPVFATVSLLLLFVNVSSLVSHYVGEGHRKPYTAFVVAENSTNLICDFYLCILWIAHLSQDDFFVYEYTWRSGVVCLIVFGLIVCFHLATLSVDCLLSMSKLMVVIHPLNSSFKKRRACQKYIIATILPSITLSILVTLVVKFLKIVLPTTLCLPFADPSNSIILTKVMTVSLCNFHTCLSITILYFHYQTVRNVQKQETHIANFKSKPVDSKKTLVMQLLITSIFMAMCWVPANIIYIYSTFCSLYPIKMTVWVSIAVVPLNSFVQPVVFMLCLIRQKRRAQKAKEVMKR